MFLHEMLKDVEDSQYMKSITKDSTTKDGEDQHIANYEGYKIVFNGGFVRAQEDGFTKFEVRSSMGAGGYSQADVKKIMDMIDSRRTGDSATKDGVNLQKVTASKSGNSPYVVCSKCNKTDKAENTYADLNGKPGTYYCTSCAESYKKSDFKTKDENGYVAFYKGQRKEVTANSSYEAQKKAAQEFGAKNSYDVSVTLAEKNGEQVVHRAVDAEQDIFKQRQIEIAKKTLRMPDAIANISGQTKEEAREILKKYGVPFTEDSQDVLTQDPLSEKGKEIMSAMKEQYGEKKGEQVFYASKNKGTIEGVDSQTKDEINIHSDMYQRGYDNMAVKFSYIPDFKTPEDKANYEAGAKAGMEYLEKNKTKDKYIFSETYKGWKIYETDNGFEATNLPGKEPIKESSLEKTKSEIDQYENYKTKDESKKKYVVLNSEFNQQNYKDLIGKEFDNPPAYAQVRVVEEKKAETADTDTKAKSIIEIYPTGDPFGRGFEASQSDDGGKSWYYRGDLGRQTRGFWRTYCQTKGYTLRTRDKKTTDSVMAGYYNGFQIHQISDTKFSAFSSYGSTQPSAELNGTSMEDIKNKIDQYQLRMQKGIMSGVYDSKKITTKTKDDNGQVGKHNETPDDQFNSEELKKGIEIEKEHSDNEEIAKSIAKDHLSEIPDYYSRLVAMETQAKEGH